MVRFSKPLSRKAFGIRASGGPIIPPRFKLHIAPSGSNDDVPRLHPLDPVRAKPKVWFLSALLKLQQERRSNFTKKISSHATPYHRPRLLPEEQPLICYRNLDLGQWPCLLQEVLITDHRTTISMYIFAKEYLFSPPVTFHHIFLPPVQSMRPCQRASSQSTSARPPRQRGPHHQRSNITKPRASNRGSP